MARGIHQCCGTGLLACPVLVLALFSSSPAAVVDRVAVVVGNHVITQSEVNDEVRLTAFLNQQPLDLGPQQRRAAAERLVDQELIRNEMKIGGYMPPTADDAEAALRSFQQEHFPSISEFRAALEKYGITEDQFKEHLLWELKVLRFTDIRFQAGSPPSPGETANRWRPGSGAPPEENGVDERMDAWLKDARSQTRIDFKKEAFQ